MDALKPIESLEELQNEAESGEPLAQYDLAVFYAAGREVPQDFAKAFYWFRKAAEQGDATAQYELGICYKKGIGVARDAAQAVHWYRLAAQKGNADAQFELGVCFRDGTGVPNDPAEAVTWFRKSAELGDASAQLALSLAYIHGDGVPKDEKEYVRWLLRSAEGGKPRAQSLLGLNYLWGKRVARDPAEGAKWIHLAAQAGYASAQSHYGRLLYFGKGVEKNRAKAVEWFQKGAYQGDEMGAYWLGICRVNGFGIEKNFDEARKWLRLAAQKNYRDSKYRLRLLFFQKYSLLKWRNTAISTIGWALLIFHGATSSISINLKAFLFFIGVIETSSVTFLLAMVVAKQFGAAGFDEKEADVLLENLFRYFKRNPWRFLYIPAEDGFFLLPLLYIGINPVSAAVAAFLFGLFHYPAFPWRYCIPKGIAYFFVALFLLRYDIWAIVLGHLFVDFLCFVAVLLAKAGGKPTLSRLLAVLREE